VKPPPTRPDRLPPPDLEERQIRGAHAAIILGFVLVLLVFAAGMAAGAFVASLPR